MIASVAPARGERLVGHWVERWRAQRGVLTSEAVKRVLPNHRRASGAGSTVLKDYTGLGVTQCDMALLTRVPARSNFKYFLGWQETPRHNVYRTFRSPGPIHTSPHTSPFIQRPTSQGVAFHFFPPPAGLPVGPACLESCPWISLS